MGFDVLPECRDDDGTSLGVNAEQASQTRIQFELERLVVQKQQNGTTDVLVARSLDLKSVSLLSGGRPSPLDQMVVRTV